MRKQLKRTQVHGERYELPEQEIEVEKLIRRGLAVQEKVREHQEDLDAIKQRLVEIATGRRDGRTTVEMKAISGGAKITFRETWEADDHAEDIAQDLGALWDRFFSKKVSFTTSKDLKAFMEERQDYGLPDPEAARALIGRHVRKKTIKPNVKLEGGEA